MGLAFLITLLAGLLRGSGLEGRPAGLFRDELEKGYNAYALAVEGGVVEFEVEPGAGPPIRWRRAPFLIDVMGVRTSAAYQYASIPFVRLWGLTARGTRAAAAAVGTLTVAVIGLLLLRLWPPGPALAATFWLAVSPWHYVFSRWALEGVFVPLAMALALAGLAAVEAGRLWGAALTGAALGFAFYAYAGAQPFILLWGAVLLVLYRSSVWRRPWSLAVGLASFLALAAPRALATFAPGGARRLESIAVWTAEDATPARVVLRVIGNYLEHFNPVFLFLRGDELPRHAIPGLGQLLLVDAVFLPVGLVVLLRRRPPLASALIAAFVCGPIGAAITRVGIPHGLRAFPMALPAAVISGVGIVACMEWLIRRGAAASASGAGPTFGSPARRGRLLAALVFLAAAAWAGRVYLAYWRLYGNDPAVREAFAHAERLAFEQAFAARGPNGRLSVNGFIPYAPYFVLFYGQLPPSETVRLGFEAQGIYLFDPTLATLAERRERLRPGDWLIDVTPAGPIALGGPLR